MARPSFWKVLQFAAGAFLVILAVRSLVLNWQELRAQPLERRFSPTWLLASVLVVFAGYAVLIEAWRRVVLSMGEQLPFWTLHGFGFSPVWESMCPEKSGRSRAQPCSPSGRGLILLLRLPEPWCCKRWLSEVAR